MEHILATIDNNFNPDNSDWIPRAVAWTIEALGLVNGSETQYRRRLLQVRDRLAVSPCTLGNDLKVFTSKGCEVREASVMDNICKPCSTGDVIQSRPLTPNTIDRAVIDKNYAPNQVAFNVNMRGVNDRYNVVDGAGSSANFDMSYTRANSNTIDINFDADCIYIVQPEIVTSHSDIYGCEVPVIPNDAKLIRFITMYCMNMMLNRGEKHPVFNLSASQYGTNPYYIWSTMQDEVMRTLLNKRINKSLLDGNQWASTFYTFTFG